LLLREPINSNTSFYTGFAPKKVMPKKLTEERKSGHFSLESKIDDIFTHYILAC
jgi:hypothetical protein